MRRSMRATRNLADILFRIVIYTPTVGTAIQQYSTIWRRPDGLFLAYPDRSIMRQLMLEMKDPKDVDLIVVTDSEGILGIGDQGVGGILISIGKGNIYTIGAGESQLKAKSMNSKQRVWRLTMESQVLILRGSCPSCSISELTIINY